MLEKIVGHLIHKAFTAKLITRPIFPPSPFIPVSSLLNLELNYTLSLTHSHSIIGPSMSFNYLERQFSVVSRNSLNVILLNDLQRSQMVSNRFH